MSTLFGQWDCTDEKHGFPLLPGGGLFLAIPEQVTMNLEPTVQNQGLSPSQGLRAQRMLYKHRILFMSTVF